MNDPITEELTEFFEFIWQDTKAWVYLPVEFEGKWTPYMFEWPRQKNGVVRHALKWSAITANVFFSPALFKRSSPKKQYVLGSWTLWVDFDGNAPKEWPYNEIPAPSLIIQSSIVGHQHCYWKLNDFLSDVSVLEDRNRSLAYVGHADTSGWDADQILRPPFVMNHKRGVPVFIKEWSRDG